MASFSEETEAAIVPLLKGLDIASASSSSSSPVNEEAIEPTNSVEDKMAERWQSLRKHMEQLRDAILDAQLEAARAEFSLDEILRGHKMERQWMEMRIMLERASIKACPRYLRINDLIMTMSYDRVTALPSVNWHLHAALCEISPADFRSEQLKRKWAQQEEELMSNQAKRAKLLAAMKKRHSRDELLKLKEENSELLVEEDDDDGKLSDVKRLDKEIESMRLGPSDWSKKVKESYKWYYPYAELISREEHLTRMVKCLTELVEARGPRDAPTESEVIGCMLLDLLITAAISPSVSATFFPAP